jgi:branched-chain amino acid transport system ATP-binding protein
VLEVDGLEAGYSSARVLNGVSLTLSEGSVVAVLGRNGMGKTTLLRSICGLRPPAIASGTIRLGGRDVTSLAPHQLVRSGISIVPQGRRVFPSLTVEENLAIAARPRRDGWTVGRVYETFVRLRERARQRAGTLSGGEQQMLAIGRALMTNPDVLVMDEPSEGLAPVVVAEVGERIRELRTNGLAILLAEQNVDLALTVADSIEVIGESGTIAWSGRPETLRADDALVTQLVGL